MEAPPIAANHSDGSDRQNVENSTEALSTQDGEGNGSISNNTAYEDASKLPVESAKQEDQAKSVASTSKGLQAESVSEGDIASQHTQMDASSDKNPTLMCKMSAASFDTVSFSSGSEAFAQNLGIFRKHPVPSSSKADIEHDITKRKKVELFGPDEGPKWYNVRGKLVTPPIITKNLPEIYGYLPIFGKPKSKTDMESFYSNKIREFVGYDMNDEQFEKLEKLCSPNYLKTGKELTMPTAYPTSTVLSVFDHQEYDTEESKLCVVQKQKLRMLNDTNNGYLKWLKYRGIRLMPLSQTETLEGEEDNWDLEPGKDILYRVRIYRPFPYNIKEKQVSSRHSVFSRDVVMVGRERLSALRDRLVCPNDAGLRLDASLAPDDVPTTSAKELFPSGFLFINNTFYVDARGACADRSAPVREWARAKGIGDFAKRDLHSTRLDEINIRLGHPEVYVHQGNCEHLFTFSEVRLLNADDPLSSSAYPTHTALSQNQSIYCTTCAEFGAKWIVVGCSTVPFDPAYFCDTCLKMYLYKDNKKLGEFKCYSYRGNEMNILKPLG